MIVNLDLEKNRSTSDALEMFTNRCFQALNNTTSTVAIFIDFLKAFDAVNHDILIQKLIHYGIMGNELDRFKSYLTNFQQCMRLNSIVSEYLPVNCGVPAEYLRSTCGVPAEYLLSPSGLYYWTKLIFDLR